MASGHFDAHYSNKTFCCSSKFEDSYDTENTRRTRSPGTSRPSRQTNKTVTRSIPHIVYEQLKLLDPGLPLLPSFIREDQALGLVEVAIGVIGKRMHRTEDELQILRSDYDKLRIKAVETAQRTNRNMSLTYDLEDRSPVSTARSRVRRRETNTGEQEMYQREELFRKEREAFVQKINNLEEELRHSNKKSKQLESDNKRKSLQLELWELKVLEYNDIKGKYSALVQDFAQEEARTKQLSDTNAELSSQLLSLQSEIKSLKAKVSSHSHGIPSISMLSTALEKEKSTLQKERQDLFKAKRDWVRTRSDPNSQLFMAWEDLHSHWLRLDETASNVFSLQEGIRCEESKLQEEKSYMESTVQLLESIHEDVERDKEDLTAHWSLATQERKALAIHAAELQDMKTTLESKETRLAQQESMLQERMRSLQKLQHALNLHERQLALDCRSEDSDFVSINLPRLPESPIPVTDLTPRDVITPESTEESPRFIEEG